MQVQVAEVHVHHFFSQYIDEEQSPISLSQSRAAMFMTQDILLPPEPSSSEGGVRHVNRFHGAPPQDHEMDSWKQQQEKREKEQHGNVKILHHYYDALALHRPPAHSRRFAGPEHSVDDLLHDVASIRRALRWALRIELFAIPPYLYAMYSVKDPKCGAAALLRSIAAEEMLHAALVANLLVALGGQPVFYDPAGLFKYPGQVPHCSSVMLSLRKLSPEALTDVFIPLESPSGSVRDLSASQLVQPKDDDDFECIGHLYLSILGALERLSRRGEKLFENPRVAQQLSNRNYKTLEHNSPDSGGLTTVTSMAEARTALLTIIHQGEGVSDEVYSSPSHASFTHRHKLELVLQDVLNGQVPVYPCVADPKSSTFSEPLQIVSDCFNCAYAALLVTLSELYSAPDDEQQSLNGRMYALMEKFMRPCAQVLTSSPIRPGATENAGPTFEPYVFREGENPIETLRALGTKCIELFPSMQEKMGKGLEKLK